MSRCFSDKMRGSQCRQSLSQRNYTIPLDVNSNGQCSPPNYVLNVQIFIYKYRIVGNALNKKNYGEGYSFGSPQCLNQWFSILVLGTPCPACFRCFPPQTHLIQINGSLSGPFIWIRCVGAGKYLKHAGQGVPRTRIENHWSKLWLRPSLICCPALALKRWLAPPWVIVSSIDICKG